LAFSEEGEEEASGALRLVLMSRRCLRLFVLRRECLAGRSRSGRANRMLEKGGDGRLYKYDNNSVNDQKTGPM
jgi:hypothetical protein